jgi:hypoxanthine phosphoribosyltransferase
MSDLRPGEILIARERIAERVAELGAEISRDYEGREVLLLCILKGAVLFIADLARELTVPCELDFMAVSSYGSSTSSSGVVRIVKDLDAPIANKHVLLVEDIVDSGLTLTYLLKNLAARGPASLEIATLLAKPGRAGRDLPVRYVGFELPDVFVVGYGLDYAQRYRNLPYIARLEEG